jgi:hypothetical protein
MFRRSAPLTFAVLALAGAAGAADPGADASKTYRIATEGSTIAAKVGEKGKLVLFIEPTVPKVHVNAQAPLKIKIEAPAGLELGKGELGRKDAVDPRAEAPRFEVPFTATAAGVQQAKANLDFYICSDAWCVKQVKTVAIAVEVK